MILLDLNCWIKFRLFIRRCFVNFCYVFLYMTSSTNMKKCLWTVSNAIKRFFKLNYQKSNKLVKVDFAYTHKDSNGCDHYQVVEWTNWPRKLKKYIGALGQIERVMKLRLYKRNDRPGPWEAYEFHVKLTNQTTDI